IQPGRILIDKYFIRIHFSDLLNKNSWKLDKNIQKIFQIHKKQLNNKEFELTNNSSLSDISSSDTTNNIVWSPLPCSNCHVIIGSIQLTIHQQKSQTISNDMSIIDPVTPNSEVKLYKHQLSNCFRKKT